MNAMDIYAGSDGRQTTALYHRLGTLGERGEVAINLFRACKCSSRAKVYRGRGYRDAAYDRKQWSLDNLSRVLQVHAIPLQICWGWKIDPRQDFHKWVLYVDLPHNIGQVSFHTENRGAGPDYPYDWDQVREASATRICKYVQQLLDEINETTKATSTLFDPATGGPESGARSPDNLPRGDNQSGMVPQVHAPGAAAPDLRA